MTRDKNLVLRSINDDGALACVDLFQRPDGGFGFEEYRRDAEDPSRWYAVGYFGDMIFRDLAAAEAEALRRVSWLRNAIRD